MVIDAAKQCPYYFGRFYAIEVSVSGAMQRSFTLLGEAISPFLCSYSAIMLMQE